MDDDKKLSQLLNEWKLPGAPSSLDARVLPHRSPWWRRSIRVPAPVALAVVAALIVMAVALLRHHPVPPQPSTSIDLAGFQPVKDLHYRIIRGKQ